MNKIELTVRWTKKGDAIPNQREKIWSVEIPLQRESTSIEDLLLAIPKENPNSYSSGNQYHAISLPGERDSIVDFDLVEAILAVRTAYAERQKKEEEQRKLQEQKIAEERSLELPKIVAAMEALANAELPLELLLEKPYYSAIQWEVRPESGLDFRPLVRKYKKDLDPDLVIRCEKKIKMDYLAKEERDKIKDKQVESEKQVRKEARNVLSNSWAEQYGSELLRKQIALGYSGWSLYLRERLQKDFPEMTVEIDNTEDDYTLIQSPTMEQLELEEKIIQRLVYLNCSPSAESAAHDTQIVYAIEEKDDDGWHVSKTRKVYVTCVKYYPGPAEIFEKPYHIRFPL